MIVFGIVSGLIVYVMIGLFINGFANISPDSDTNLFMAMAIFWPLFTIALIVTVIVKIPIYLGRKLGNKYLRTVDNALAELLNN